MMAEGRPPSPNARAAKDGSADSKDQEPSGSGGSNNGSRNTPSSGDDSQSQNNTSNNNSNNLSDRSHRDSDGSYSATHELPTPDNSRGGFGGGRQVNDGQNCAQLMAHPTMGNVSSLPASSFNNSPHSLIHLLQLCDYPGYAKVMQEHCHDACGHKTCFDTRLECPQWIAQAAAHNNDYCAWNRLHNPDALADCQKSCGVCF